MASKRYFEFSEGTSNKFWEVWREGAQVFTRYGKIGAAGQVTVKKLGADADAKKLLDKLVGEKTGKGYVEGGGKKAAKGAGKAAAADDLIVIPDGAMRLELVEGKSAKFWQVHRKDKTVTVTFGKIGTPGTVTKKKYDSDYAARVDAKKQLEAKKQKGYQYVIAGPRVAAAAPGATNPQLEAAIVKDPADDGGYMVYGDWLMEQGDPRGPLAAIRGDDKKAQTKASAMVWKNRPVFFGPLAIYTVEKPDRHSAVAAEWKQGWMTKLRLSAVSSWREGQLPVSDCSELVRLLPKVTSARLLRELVIGCPRVEDEFYFGNTITELVKAMPALPNLRRLVLGDFTYEDSELSWSHLGSLQELWKHAGKLEYLKIHAGNLALGKINAPELRELWIESGGFDNANLDELMKGHLPKLETLNIWMGQDNYGCDIRPKNLAKFIDGLAKKFPKLRHLGLANSQWGNEIAPLLVKSKILGQITSLNLSMSHLTEEGMRVYAAHKDAFKHLTSLDVSRCLLGNEGKKLAKALCKNVDVDRQDDPSDHQPEEGDDADSEDIWWRYSAVGE